MRGASPLVCKCNGQVISHKIVERGLVNDDRVEYPTEAKPSTTVDDETIENHRPFTLLLKKKLNDLRSAEEGQISIIYFATIQKEAGGRSTQHRWGPERVFCFLLRF